MSVSRYLFDPDSGWLKLTASAFNRHNAITPPHERFKLQPEFMVVIGANWKVKTYTVLHPNFYFYLLLPTVSFYHTPI